MILQFDSSIAEGYRSNSQKVRVMSEAWMASFMFCPCCGAAHINSFDNNKPVADFFCAVCGEEYELKSKGGNLGKKIVDGAYDTAIERITSNNNPDLFVLQYSQTFAVQNLFLIPKYFFVPAIIEKRTPLASSARRAGWTGSNIVFSEIPEQGKLSIIRNGVAKDKDYVVEQYARTKQLQTKDIARRGWLMDTLTCINSIPDETFTLADMYMFTEKLENLHRENHNVQAKIRQQLQILRDKGYLEFIEKGVYKKL